MPEPSSSSTTDRVLGGRYRLVTPIARGGMAEVWEGHDEVLGRPVAVKVLHSHLSKDDGFTERFRREAVAAAKLVHPGIVNIFDTGTDGDTAFIVMELVRGRTLRDAIEAEGSLPVSTAVHVAMDVADALDCAHRNGLIHRDVKPANILLTEIPGTKAVRVKVTDFGIAKAQAGGSDLTQTGAVIG
ncbi:MAG TPA: protein kinase, partial [Acidimicrobiales bacterium]|nr:protein kinase [Acidimicrobiales bacterium]